MFFTVFYFLAKTPRPKRRTAGRALKRWRLISGGSIPASGAGGFVSGGPRSWPEVSSAASSAGARYTDDLQPLFLEDLQPDEDIVQFFIVDQVHR